MLATKNQLISFCLAAIFLSFSSRVSTGFHVQRMDINNNNCYRVKTTRREVLLRRKKEEQLEVENDDDDANGSTYSIRSRASRVKDLAKRLVLSPLTMASNTIPMPQAIASVLKDASLAAVEEVEKVEITADLKAIDESKNMIMSVIDDAFAPVEASLAEMEESLGKARESLEAAKLESYQAVEAIQVAAIAQAEGAASALAQAEQVAESQVLEQIYSSALADIDISELAFDDVDFESSEMAPPFLDPNSCLIPGEPIVRVERAPENSRRIFAGIDIMASVDDVWNVSCLVLYTVNPVLFYHLQ